MLQQAYQALAKAKDSLSDTTIILQNGLVIAAVNRGYYTFYYAVCALLFTEGVYTKSHKGTIVQYNQLFVKDGRLPTYTSQWISDAFALRQAGNYDFYIEIEEEKAQKLVERASHFLKLVEEYITRL